MADSAENEEMDELPGDEAETSHIDTATIPQERTAPVGQDTARQEEHVSSERSEPSNIIPSILVGGFVITAFAAVIAYIYLIQSIPSRHLLARSDEMPETSASPTATATAPLRPAPTLGRLPSGELIPVAADMLHVTSIALGDLHLAIVNEKRLAEGDWLKMTTPAGVTFVQLVSLEDGVAHFDYGGQAIDSKLQVTLAPKKSLAPLSTPKK